MFASRAVTNPQGRMMPMEDIPSRQVLAGNGACSHAGLINVLTHARNRFPDVPICGVLGGFHLSGATESIIPDTVEALEQFNLSLIAAAHCTGWRAIGALATRFKDPPSWASVAHRSARSAR
jgi:metal-dependent hydrolase (beta-lactamase superfamily II)